MRAMVFRTRTAYCRACTRLGAGPRRRDYHNAFFDFEASNVSTIEAKAASMNFMWNEVKASSGRLPWMTCLRGQAQGVRAERKALELLGHGVAHPRVLGTKRWCVVSTRHTTTGRDPLFAHATKNSTRVVDMRHHFWNKTHLFLVVQKVGQKMFHLKVHASSTSKVQHKPKTMNCI